MPTLFYKIHDKILGKDKKVCFTGKYWGVLEINAYQSFKINVFKKLVLISIIRLCILVLMLTKLALNYFV